MLAGGALGSLSEIGGEMAQASGAAERLFEILAIKPAIGPPARPLTLPSPARGEVVFADVRFSYPTRPNVSALNGVSFHAVSYTHLSAAPEACAISPPISDSDPSAPPASTA